MGGDSLIREPWATRRLLTAWIQRLLILVKEKLLQMAKLPHPKHFNADDAGSGCVCIINSAIMISRAADLLVHDIETPDDKVHRVAMLRH